jgi:2-polyprenyl-6-methoxyphenol hydroxylase-like FAD-dependent oxidoreductase
MTVSSDTPVVVAGAGPTGLMMGLGLMLHGAPCRIIDKALAPSDKSKAIAIQARTLEIFERLGIVDEVVNRGHRLRGMHLAIDGRDVIHVVFDRVPSRYPYILSLPQSETERILLERLESLGGHVERQTELTGLSQDGDGVTAVMRRLDGSEERVATRFLIGCDGAHSTVRHALGMPFEGAEYEEHFLLADVKVEWRFADDEARTFLSSAGAAAFFPMAAGRHRIVAEMAQSAVRDEQEPTLAEAQALVDRLAPGTILSDPRWLAMFRIHRRKVANYREGRVFVVGDAAHIHSPVGGQGMNTGIQDAHNLAWKLALALDGAGAPALLDSYQAERHAVAEQVLRTSDTLTRMVTIRNPLARAIRDFLVPAIASQGFVQKRFSRTIAEVAVNYRRSPIVGESRPSLREALRSPALGAKAWWAFSSGPRPGDRAPDPSPLRCGSKDACRLLELIDPARHNLLLFEGIEPALKDVAGLRHAAKMAAEGFGSLIAVHLLLAESAEKSWPAQVIVDAELAAHRAYGALASCLYLIRPDGYIGFRSLPAGRDSLGGYLGRIFRLRAFGA